MPNRLPTKVNAAACRARLGLMLGWVAAILLGLSAGQAAAQVNSSRVRLETSMGTIVLELDGSKAPKTVANFLAYVQAAHYDGTVFHRVIDGFMIQGGGFGADMAPMPTRPPVANEADNGLKNKAYTVAMARTSDPHSATCQFFINVADNQRLDHRGKDPKGWGYAVFGKVVEGKDVVDKIKAVATGTRGRFDDVPLNPVTIVAARVVETTTEPGR